MSGAPDLTALAERLRRHVETVAATERPPNSPAHARTAKYILDHLSAAGFTVKDDARTTAEGFGCRNLLTEPLPRDERLPLMIIGAHYDSVRGSPGADDNASAVAALLELASWIRPHLHAGPWHARLQLVAYDLEEYGLIGSQVQAAEVRKARTPLRGMISLEMLGYTDHRPGSQQLPSHLRGLYPDVANFIGVCANEASSALLRVVVAGLKSVAGLPVEYIAVPGTGELVPQVRLSDHSSFWDEGLPALMITDTSFFRNPHYHQKTDTPDKLDYPFLAKVTAGVCTGVLQLLQTREVA